LLNEELYDLFFLPNITRMIKLWRIRWAEHVATWGDEECLQKLTAYRRIRHGRPRHRWEVNIKNYLQDIGWVWEGGGWTGLIWLRIGASGELL
jgi:hypothetical protein